MNQSRLPLPNPDEWATRAAVARHLHVDPATVSRMALAGKLTIYSPRGAEGEQRPRMFWWPEVEEFAQARKIAARGVSAVS